jgi:hypothetical protein
MFASFLFFFVWFCEPLTKNEGAPLFQIPVPRKGKGHGSENEALKSLHQNIKDGVMGYPPACGHLDR